MPSLFRSKIKSCLLIVHFWCTLGLAYAQQYPINKIGGRAVAMSGANACVRDVWAGYHNQAALAFLDGINVGIAFQNSFFVKELSTKAISFAIPTKFFVFGLNYYHFGYTKFNENKIGLAFVKKLGKKIAIGGQIDYFYTHIDGEYDNKSTTVGEIGIIAKPVNNLFISAHLFNVWNAKISGNEEQYMPNIVTIGASYIILDKAELHVNVEKDISENILVKTGIEYQLIKQLTIMIGMMGKPVSYSFGLGYNYNALQLNIAFSKHNILGYSPAVSIVYAFNKIKQK